MNLTLIQKAALVYCAMFLGIYGLNYYSPIHDTHGYMFGLFKLDLIDDMLHLGSAIWALTAALVSRKQSVLYFKIFGVLYALDGIIGLFTGLGYLDLGLFIHGPDWDMPLMTKVFANLPHIFIGGMAAFIGFYISKKIKK